MFALDRRVQGLRRGCRRLTGLPRHPSQTLVLDLAPRTQDVVEEAGETDVSVARTGKELVIERRASLRCHSPAGPKGERCGSLVRRRWRFFPR